MLKKIVVISLLLIGMIACGPSCTRRVPYPNSQYIISIANPDGKNNINLYRRSNSASEVTVDYDCSRIIDITQG